MRFDRVRSSSRRASLFVDHGDLKLAFESMDDAPTCAQFADRLVGFLDTLGRAGVRQAYGDWSEGADDARAYRAGGLDPRFVPTTSDGDSPVDLVLSLDALQHVLEVPGITTVVIATSDPGLRELIVRLRGFGRETVLIGPANETSAELVRAADRFLTIEDLLARRWGTPARHGPTGASIVRGGNGTPASPAAAFDPATYDWSRFIKLMVELEDRLAFVGLKYLNQKVLNRHNCGFDDRARRQDLINFSIDDGVLETYSVDNIGKNADPVSACRLNRDHAIVEANLPPAAAAQAAEATPDTKPAEGERESA